MPAFVHFIILAVLLLVLVNLLANLLCFDGLRAVAPPDDGPLVSVLVPARNEALNIEACIRSLLLQDYPRYELLVLDDHSTDATAEIVGRLIAQMRNPRVSARLLDGAALPDGWTGKNWACHQLFENASGEFLFFTDADTTHAPGTITATVDYACRNRASLVSAWPRMLTETLGEKLIVLMIPFVGLAFCPLWILRLIQRHGGHLPAAYARECSAANGQFLFFTRDAYEGVGGHAAHRANVVDDIALGRAVAERVNHGMRLFNCEALHFSTVRMYRSFAESWAGFTKNLRPVFENRPLNFWLFVLGLWALLTAPFVHVATASGQARTLVLAQIGILFFMRALLALRLRTSWLAVLLHPFAALIFLLLAINSWRRSTWGGVAWKGRTYRPQV